MYKTLTVQDDVREMAICKDCGDLEDFTPDEFGLNYYQSIGECNYCKKPTYYRNGNPTKEIVIFKA
jgi:hypothetical protein